MSQAHSALVLLHQRGGEPPEPGPVHTGPVGSWTPSPPFGILRPAHPLTPPHTALRAWVIIVTILRSTAFRSFSFSR